MEEEEDYLEEERARLENLTLAVRDTSVSRYNGAQLRAPLEPLNTIML